MGPTSGKSINPWILITSRIPSHEKMIKWPLYMPLWSYSTKLGNNLGLSTRSPDSIIYLCISSSTSPGFHTSGFCRKSPSKTQIDVTITGLGTRWAGGSSGEMSKQPPFLEVPLPPKTNGFVLGNSRDWSHFFNPPFSSLKFLKGWSFQKPHVQIPRPEEVLEELQQCHFLSKQLATTWQLQDQHRNKHRGVSWPGNDLI